jgi:glycerophosphoryl diester phosphodiesterase
LGSGEKHALPLPTTSSFLGSSVIVLVTDELIFFETAAMPFDLQGHRGARGLKPENTLPGFETALDIGVNTIETDVRLTLDGIPILFHDSNLSTRVCRLRRGHTVPDLTSRPRICDLTLDEIRHCLADRNPDRRRFPDQDRSATPLARLFAKQQGIHPYSPPTVVELFAFVSDYAGVPGEKVGKTDAQRERATRVVIDLELKREPYKEASGEALEHAVVTVVRSASAVEHTAVRSFDHRAVLAVRQLEPRLRTGVLIAGTAPVDPVALVRSAGADGYYPDFTFLDRQQVEQCRQAGIRVVPWTVNDPQDWDRLIKWGVDGITTDYPAQCSRFIDSRSSHPVANL